MDQDHAGGGIRAHDLELAQAGQHRCLAGFPAIGQGDQLAQIKALDQQRHGFAFISRSHNHIPCHLAMHLQSQQRPDNQGQTANLEKLLVVASAHPAATASGRNDHIDWDRLCRG